MSKPTYKEFEKRAEEQENAEVLSKRPRSALRLTAKKYYKFMLLASGLGSFAIILYLSYISHKNFKEAIVSNFNNQQVILLNSIQTDILEYFSENRQNLQHIADDIISANSSSNYFEYLSAMHKYHLDDFNSISLVDKEGRIILTTPQIALQDSALTFLTYETIQRNMDNTSPFFSERYFDIEGNALVNLFVPFTLPDEEQLFVMGTSPIDNYLETYIAALISEDICLVLIDNDGHLLSSVTSDSENHGIEMMGNIRSLDEKCLACHKQDDFDDIIQAIDEQKIVVNVHKYPDSEMENRITSSFDIHNEKWSLSVCSPYESVQGVIEDNATAVSIYFSISLFILGIFGVLTYRIQKGKAVLEAEADNLREIARISTSLKKSESKYRRLTENAKDMIYRMSLPDGKYEFVSEASNNIFGYSPEEFYNDSNLLSKVTHPDWQDYLRKEWKNLLSGNMRSFYEGQIIHKSGETRWLNQRNVLITSDDNVPIAIEGIVTDITERKKTESIQQVLYNILNATLQSESLGKLLDSIHTELNTLLEAKNFYVALYDQKTDTYTFPYYVDEFDKVEPDEQLELRNGFTEYVRRHREPFIFKDENIQKLLKSGEIEFYGSQSMSWMGVPLMKGKEPFGVVAIQSYTNPDAFTKEDLTIFSYVSGQIAVAIERKWAEEERIRNEKLIGVIEMAGAACHELNQPLQSIMGYSRLIAFKIDESSSFKGEIDMICKAAIRLGKITEGIQSISKYETVDYLDRKIIDIKSASK